MENRQYDQNRPRPPHRGGGNRGGGHRGGHRGGQRSSYQGGRGRPQRPLLTSSTNAAGLSLVAMVLMDRATNVQAHDLLGWAVIAFLTSAFVSYFAQRSKRRGFELTSDLSYMAGILIVFCVVLVRMQLIS
jgi:hypothetical protein